MPAGRPTDYTPELAERICEWLAGGKSLRSFCRQDNTPHVATVTRWIVTHQDFRDDYEIAKLQGQAKNGAAWRVPNRPKSFETQFVYCMGLVDADYFKIGVSSDPDKRLRQVQTANPYEVEMVAVVSGGRKLEAMIHKKIAPLRVRGEWFSLDEPMLLAVLSAFFLKEQS